VLIAAGLATLAELHILPLRTARSTKRLSHRPGIRPKGLGMAEATVGRPQSHDLRRNTDADSPAYTLWLEFVIATKFSRRQSHSL
jgi:hypothetical protein